jgi:fumarate reductase flavoprotein subunit
MKKITTDVAVLGGGPAGLAATLRAAEFGLDVSMFEKVDTFGGVYYGGIGPFAAGSHIQKKYGMTDGTVENAYNYLIDFTHGTIDARLASAYIHKTAFTIKWLEDHGVIFADPKAGQFANPNDTEHFCHTYDPSPDFPGVERYIPNVLMRGIESHENAHAYFNTWGKKLIKTDGKITGLLCETKDGEEIEVTCSAVIIATGGFMGNPALIKKYTSYENNVDIFFSRQRPNICGDGMQMAWDVGAGHSDMMIDAYKGMPIYCGPMGTKEEWALLSDPNLFVNLRGERFISETCERYYLANAIHRQPKGTAFLITASNLTDEYKNGNKVMGGPPGMPAPYNDVDQIIAEAKALNYPYIYEGNSIEELAEKIGINAETLKETIAEYNQSCEKGVDEVFFKKTNLDPLLGPKYYAAQFFVDSFGALGGLLINYKTEVVTDDFVPIPGLYGAGSEVNALYAGTYPGRLSGNTSGFAYNSGVMAAEAAASYIQR